MGAAIPDMEILLAGDVADLSAAVRAPALQGLAPRRATPPEQGRAAGAWRRVRAEFHDTADARLAAEAISLAVEEDGERVRALAWRDPARPAAGWRRNIERMEGAGEGAQLSTQFIMDWVVRTISAGGRPESFNFQEFKEGLAESTYKGALGGIAIGGAGGVARVAQESYDARQARKYGQSVALVTQLAERSPAQQASREFAALVEEATGETGEPVTHIYVDPKQMVDLVGRNDGDVDAVATELMGQDGPRLLREALAERSDLPGGGATLEVSVKDWLERWGGTELGRQLIDDIQARPGLMTRREQVLHQGSVDEHRARLESFLDGDPDIEDLSIEEQEYVKELEGQLISAGMSPNEARVNAALDGAMIRTMLARTPKAASDVFGRARKSVQRAAEIVQASSVDSLRRAYEGMSDEQRVAAFFTDRNTGLLTIRGLEVSPRDPSRPFLAQFDLEGGKFINDTHGHASLDGAFRLMGQTLSKLGVKDGGKVGGSVVAWVRDANHAREIAAAMRESIDPRLAVTTEVAEAQDSVAETLEIAGERHGRLKMRLGARGDIGHRKGAPASFMEGLRIEDKERGQEGLPIDDPRIVEAMERAAAALAPVAQRMKEALRVDDTLLTEQHRETFEDSRETAFRDIYFEQTGLLSQDGWEAARELNPKAFVTSSDLRAFKEMNDAWGKDGTDAINQLFGEFAEAVGGGMVDMSHPHGDEYHAQADTREQLEQFFRVVENVTSRIIFTGEVEIDGRRKIVLQKGMSLAHGTAETMEQADGVELPKAKDAQGEKSLPEIYDAKTEADAAKRRYQEIVRELGSEIIGSFDVSSLSRARSEEAFRRRAGEVFHQKVRLLSRARRSEVQKLGERLLSDTPELEAAAHVATVSMMSRRPRRPVMGSRDEAFMAIMGSLPGDIDSSPTEQADGAYRKFKAGVAPRPPPHPGGLFDEINKELERESGLGVSGVQEAWDELSRLYRVRTWDDVGPVVEMLQRVDGLEGLQLPDHVLNYEVEVEAWERSREHESEYWAKVEAGAIDEISLEQPGDGSPKGWVQITKDAVSRQFRVFLGKGSDFSTFAHESAHVYRRLLQEIAEHPEVADSVRRDYQQLLNWFGVESTDQITVENEEQFARAFEAYLRDGKSPSVGLSGVFYSFRTWLSKIYRTVRGLEVEVDPQIRGIFDRMLATDREISRMREAMGADLPIARSPAELGVTGDSERWQQYLEGMRRSTTLAAQRTQKRIYRLQLKAAERLKSDAFKRAKSIAEAEFRALPESQAWAFMRTGKLTDENGEVIETGPGAGMVDREFFREMFGEGHPLERSLRGRMREGGEHPSSVATRFGFGSAEEMVDAVLNRPDRKTFVSERAEDLVSEDFPTLDGEMKQLSEMAADAMHGRGSQEQMLRDLRYLRSRATEVNGERIPASRLPPEVRAAEIPVESIRQTARNHVERGPVRRLNKDLALRRERSYAEQALEEATKGNYVAAMVAKQRQIYQMEVWRATRDAKRDLEKLKRLGKKQGKDRALALLGLSGLPYRDVMASLLEGLGFRRSPLRPPPRRGLDQLVNHMEGTGQTIGFDEDLVRDLLESPVPVKDLTVSQMRDAHRAISNIWKSAINTREVSDGKRKVDREKALEELRDSALGGDNKWAFSIEKVPSSRDAMSGKERALSFFSAVDGALLRPSTMLMWLADQSIDSPWYRYIVRPLQKAKAREVDILNQHVRPVVELFENMPSAVRKRISEPFEGAKFFPDHVKKIDPPTKRFEIIMMALNRGNAVNLERLTMGRGITVDQIDRALGELTREELEFVRTVQGQIESMWPLVKELEERDTGMAPEKMTAMPYQVRLNSGESVSMPGGYFPLIYDSRVSAVGQRQEVQRISDVLDGSYVRPGTSRSHTRKRVERLRAVVDLSPVAIQRHLSQVAHDLAFREPLRDAASLMLDESIQDTLNQALGVNRAKVLKQWLTDIGRQHPAHVLHLNEFGKVLNKARGNFSTAVLGYTVRLVAADWLALVRAPLTSSATFRGVFRGAIDMGLARKSLAGAFFDLYRDHDSARDFALEKSGELRARSKGYVEKFQREMRDFSRQRGAAKKMVEFYADHAFWLHEQMDKLVSTTLWLGTYRQHLQETGVEARAIEEADLAVQKILPSRNVVDDSAIMRDQSWISAFVNMHTYFNTLYQAYREVAQPALTSPDFKTFMKRMPPAVGMGLSLMLIEGPIAEFIIGYGPVPDDGETEEERWATWFARKMLFNPIATVPILGGVAEVGASALTGANVSMRTAPLTSMGDAMVKAMAKASGTDRDPMDVAMTVAKAYGLLRGIPTEHLKAVDYFYSLWQGEAREEGLGGAASGVIYGERPERYQPLTPPLLLERMAD